MWGGGDGRNDGGEVSGAVVAVNTSAPEPASFGILDASMRLKFQRAGLGNGRGMRTPYEAEQMFHRTVPSPVRNMGSRRAVSDFLEGKEGSHIESVTNAPDKARNVANLVWESSKRNRSRGSANMSRAELLRARATNGVDTANAVAKRAAGLMGRAAVLAAAMEFAVSASEGTIRVAKGKVSKKDVAKETVVNTAKAGVLAGTVALGTAALGAGPVLAAVSPVVIPAGLAMYGVSSVRRIREAARDPQPLESVALYFHAGCVECGSVRTCYESFAAEVGGRVCPA